MKKTYEKECRDILRILPTDERLSQLPFPIQLNLSAIEIVALREALITHLKKAERQVLKFPLEYRSWRIEIRMGREFKGARGSTKACRGYVATRLADGKVHEFMPSDGNSVQLSLVRATIDILERSEAKYSSKEERKAAAP